MARVDISRKPDPGSDEPRALPASALAGLGYVLRSRPYRWFALTAGVIYAIVYLSATRSAFLTSVDQSRFASIPSVRFADSISLGSFTDRFENVVIVYLHDNLVVTLSIPIIVFALVLSTLVGLSVGSAVYNIVGQRRLSCSGAGSALGIFGALPSFLASFSCCAPTILLIVGANFAALTVTLLPFATPLSVLLLLALVAWNGRKAFAVSQQAPHP